MRLGVISYCNPRPVDGWLIKHSQASGISTEQAVPTVLNQKMLNGELDVSAVSLMHYAEHFNNYYLLPEVVIAADKAVQSVLLVSKLPLEQVQHIAFTGEGRTTPGLCELLFALKGFKKPSFSNPATSENQCDANLLIGDEALKFFSSHQFEDGAYITDLSELWNHLTGRSAVFAVWVVRKEYAQRNELKVQEFQNLLLQSRQWGALHLNEIINEAAGQLGLNKSIMTSYFTNLRYDFTADLLESAEFFTKSAFNHGLLSKEPTFNLLHIHDEKIGDRR